MKHTNIVALIILIISIFIIVASCTNDAIQTPYIISGLKSIQNQKQSLYEISGIDFTLLNCSGKTISEFTASMMVFTEDKKNPFIGSNKITASFSGIIYANASHDFSICLDSYLNAIPHSEFLIDFFSLTEIKFSDGTIWRDRYGIFYTRSYK